MCKYFLNTHCIHDSNTLVNITTIYYTNESVQTLVQTNKLLFHCVKLITLFMLVFNLICSILFT